MVSVNRNNILEKLPKSEIIGAQQTKMMESLKDVFVKARFGSEKTPRVQKKKLNVVAGKSISQNNQQVTSTSTAQTERSMKAKKEKKKPVLFDTSSESDIDERVLTVDSDNDTETFSNYQHLDNDKKFRS